MIIYHQNHSLKADITEERILFNWNGIKWLFRITVFVVVCSSLKLFTSNLDMYDNFVVDDEIYDDEL